MKKLLSTFAFICIVLITFAQQRIDGSFEFQTDPAKKYSIYIPSDYNENVANKLMLGLHPLNPSAWDGEAWCDTLIAFAEANQLLLVCPDGGTDGAIDDPIDVAFTTVLLDSMELWYNVDTSKVYAMGFSWGARATYTYGLTNIPRLKGFIPIGAAINGTSEVNSIIQNASGRPFYLVHGGNDSPNVRFFPVLEALEDNDALTNSILMNGVGHTINFPNRNQILTTAFHWIDSVHCASLITTAVVTKGFENTSFSITPNPAIAGQQIILNISGLQTKADFDFMIFDLSGNVVRSWNESIYAQQEKVLLAVDSNQLSSGLYYLRLMKNRKVVTNLKLIIME